MQIRAISFALVTLAAPLAAQESSIQRSALPAAVERTVAEQSKGATIRGLSKEVDQGKTTYELELRVGGLNKDILIDTTGTIVLIEEQVIFDSLAADVRQGITAQAGTAPISMVEKLIKGGKLVAYEAHLRVNGKAKEIQVGPNGEKLDHEE